MLALKHLSAVTHDRSSFQHIRLGHVLIVLFRALIAYTMIRPVNYVVTCPTGRGVPLPQVIHPSGGNLAHQALMLCC